MQQFSVWVYIAYGKPSSIPEEISQELWGRQRTAASMKKLDQKIASIRGTQEPCLGLTSLGVSFHFTTLAQKAGLHQANLVETPSLESQKMWQMTAQLSSETLKTWGRIEGKLVIKDKIIRHHNKNFHCGLGQSKLCHGSIEKSRQCIWNANKRKSTALWEFSGWICLYFLTTSGQFSGYKHLFTREELHCIL